MSTLHAIKYLEGLKHSAVISVWFMFLTFPIMVIRVNTIENVIEWRWMNLMYIGCGSFVLSFLWRALSERGIQKKNLIDTKTGEDRSLTQRILGEQKIYLPALGAIAVFAVIFPFVFSTYQTSIMTTALMYVVLGLGLNIVVGQAGLLNLGYVAFYAAGAYTYALLYQHFGIGFWMALPLGALAATVLGILLALPVLRLQGDYLAIVTLGFGEITRIVLENWNEFSFGPSGISGIPRPGLFGMEMSIHEATVYLYFLMILFCIITVFVVNRLQNSRIGRALLALREDEIACQTMGIDKTRVKLTAFALGSTWAGLVGVIFAAKTTFVNPASFTFLESAMILSIVVLGGMGSIPGIIIGAFLLILLPEYLRAFSDYRMLIFGIIMVIMMIFRPQGIVSGVRRTYTFHREEK
ncbi:MAG: high-affinity branched-chain amino acid ABC transporter permease LivM [Syntrophaceae bacterium]|nr:high-affinity branched-chain amino acid ABC transporter permease LivM [Syntrophaceae bacterium]